MIALREGLLQILNRNSSGVAATKVSAILLVV
jgi:hypothetical protein